MENITLYAEFEINDINFRSEWNESATINIFVEDGDGNWINTDCITNYELRDKPDGHKLAAEEAYSYILEEMEEYA
jgi:hypothetical protein